MAAPPQDSGTSMPQQPSSPMRRSSDGGKGFVAFALAQIRSHLGLHKLANGVAKQALIVGERKIH